MIGAALRENATLETIRRLLFGILAIGVVGTGVDLLLLAHYDGPWQIPPLVLVAVALIVMGWVMWTRGTRAIMALRVTMVLFIAAGLAGFILHFNGNREFQKEIDPSLGGWALVVTVMRAKAPPALAPAVMIQLGLLGFLYTYRHPALAAAQLTKGAST